MICKYDEMPDGAMCRPKIVNDIYIFKKKNHWLGVYDLFNIWEVKDDHIVEPNKKDEPMQRKTEGLTLGEMIDAVMNGAECRPNSSAPWRSKTSFFDSDGNLRINDIWCKFDSFTVRYPEKKSRVITESEWRVFTSGRLIHIQEIEKFLFEYLK